MQTALATRGYTNKQIKPLLAPRLAEEFLPQSVPAYSATEIFNTLRETNPEYTYKEATLNPTNPRDRTVDWEADVVNAFRADRKLHGDHRRAGRARSGARSTSPARSRSRTRAACAATRRRSSTPASVVKALRDDDGYGWKLNETVGAQIVSVPMAVPIAMATKAFQATLWRRSSACSSSSSSS